MGNRLSIQEFIRAFLKGKGLYVNDLTFNQIAGDGSKRLFIRITVPDSGLSFIVLENRPETDFQKKENLAYLMIGRHLLGKGLPLPEIYDYDPDNGWFIVEDLGDIRLQDEVLHRDDSIRLLENVVEILFKIQINGIKGFKKDWCCQTERYDRFVMRRYESQYFRNYFLTGYLGIKMEWLELEESFDHLSVAASMAPCSYFLHRDFQSRNIMIHNNKMGILDWQGGRIGPLGYDLASLLLDPYINIPTNEKKHLYGQYLSILKQYDNSLLGSFERYFPYLAVQRNLQILGAFSYLSKILGKDHFKEYIPCAVKSLCQILDELADPKLSPLKDIVYNLAKEYFLSPGESI